MKNDSLYREIQRDQAAILRKLTIRRIRLAAIQVREATLMDEIEQLQRALVDAAPEALGWRDDDEVHGDPDSLPCSEMNIPLPAVAGEHIVIDSRGTWSNYHGFTPYEDEGVNE